MWPLLLALACTSPPEEPAPAEVVVAPTGTPPLPEPTAVPTEERYAATHVLVAWDGAAGLDGPVGRDEAEARSLAEEIHRSAVAGADLEELAREHSSCPSAPRGGRLGVYLTGTMVPAFESAVASVGVGQLGPLVRTPFGYHVVRRDAVVQARAAHVLVAWDGALRSGATRSRDEARARIEEVQGRAARGEDFAALATEYSEDSTAGIGGELGWIAPGQMVPAFEDALFALQPGLVSDVVESPYGFHVIRRLV